MLLSLAARFTSAFLLALILVPICREIAVRLGFVAKPRDDRWHRRPVATLGGLAIAASVFMCTAIFGIAVHIPVLVGTVALMFGTGVVDDLIVLKPSTKLIVQIALAAVLLLFDYRLNWFRSETLDRVVSLVWVVGLTNAFNLLDNMDGLCAGIVLIVGAALLVDLLPGAPDARALYEAQYLAVLLGAAAGFLVYNLYPASIFMGDAGSLLLGFSVAAVTLSPGHQATGRSDVLSIVAAPVLVLLIPIFDTTLVTVSRWFSGRRASQGGRDHSSHRLVAIGLSERRAVALLWTLAAIGGTLGVAVARFSYSWSAHAAGLTFLLAMILFAVYLGGIRVYDDAAQVAEGSFTPIIVEFMHKRRVAEVLLDFCLVTICYYAAYRLRFEDPEEFMRNFEMFLRSLPVILASQMLAFFVVGVYRGVWRHFGLIDALVVAKGVFLGSLCAQLAILYVYRFFAYSRTVFAIDGVLLLIAVILSRASFRLVGEFVRRQRRSGRRMAIYGAGTGGTLVLSELLAAEDETVRIVGFIDDDPRKAGIRVQGYPVLGGYSALTVLVRASSIDGVVVSARRMPPERLNNLAVLCSEHHIPLSRLHIGLEPIVELDEPTQTARATLHQVKL
jgi:UDP-GlcNAc:undecaprenyl-phosphate/decaprenyl-phosphate GlcNAc-1-phosphate transferase